MPFVPFPQTAQFDLRLTVQGQECNSSLYFDVPFGTEWFEEGLLAVASDLSEWWDTSLRPLVSNQVRLVEVRGTSLASQNAPVASFSEITPLIGIQEQQPMPNNVTFSVSFRTGFRGRGARGRNYAYGLVENQVNGNVVDPTLVDQWVAAYKQLRTYDFSTPAEWVVASRWYQKVRRIQGVTTPITNVVVADYYVDSQRRRLPGRGR